MNVVELTEERFVVEFNYCPLIAGWITQTEDEEELAELSTTDTVKGVQVTIFPIGWSS